MSTFQYFKDLTGSTFFYVSPLSADLQLTGFKSYKKKEGSQNPSFGNHLTNPTF